MDKELHSLLLEIKSKVDDWSSIDEKQDKLLTKISDDLSDVKERISRVEGTVGTMSSRLCSPSVKCQDQEMISAISNMDGRMKYQSWLVKAIVGVTLMACVGSGFGVIQSCQTRTRSNDSSDRIERIERSNERGEGIQR